MSDRDRVHESVKDLFEWLLNDCQLLGVVELAHVHRKQLAKRRVPVLEDLLHLVHLEHQL